MNRLFWGVLLLMASLQEASAGGPSKPLGCLIEPFSVADIGSSVTGVIETMRAERGDRVTKGQPLASLRADVEKATVDVASNRAQATGDYNAAVNNAELARQKLVRAKDLADKEFISPQALEQSRAEAAIAENRLAQAREQRVVLSREHALAQAQLGMRTIRSPVNGVIADRYLSVGERVEEKAVFRVAVIDPLRVEVVMPSSLYGVLRAGMTVLVIPEFPGALPRRGRVVLVDKLIDGASNTFRVRLELPNPGLTLPAGLRCKAEIDSASQALPVAPDHLVLQSVRVARPADTPPVPSSLLLRMDATLSPLKTAKP